MSVEILHSLREKEPLVYVPMVADFIHHGHINIINTARELGTVVVGLMTDRSACQYKRLPTLPFEDRKKIVENLSGVDFIVPQDEPDYVGMIRQIKPKFFVHGTDWQSGVQKISRERVIQTMSEWGGLVVEPEYTNGISSTEINNRLKQLGTTSDVRRFRLKRLLSAKNVLRGMEAHSGITGLIIENVSIEKEDRNVEFDFMWLSSLTDSTAKGKPDTELVDPTSRYQTLHDILDVTTKPIIFDGDTGGQIDHFKYLVRTLERLGVSAVIIEDKNGLKKNSLLGNDVLQTQESIDKFCQKIQMGKSSQVTEEFMIIARIESLILEKGVEDAILRAKEYIEAGADGIMIHSRRKEPDEIREFCLIYNNLPNRVPLVAVPSTYDSVTESELGMMGVNIVIYANQLLRAAYPAMIRVAESILTHGRAADSVAEMMPIREILNLVPGTN